LWHYLQEAPEDRAPEWWEAALDGVVLGLIFAALFWAMMLL
jgi:hypothetical protein